LTELCRAALQQSLLNVTSCGLTRTSPAKDGKPTIRRGVKKVGGGAIYSWMQGKDVIANRVIGLFVELPALKEMEKHQP